MQTLAEASAEVTRQYGNLWPIEVSSEQIRLDEEGLLCTGKNRFPMTDEGAGQFMQAAKIPVKFAPRLSNAARSVVFNTTALPGRNVPAAGRRERQEGPTFTESAVLAAWAPGLGNFGLAG